jgi:CBS domain-containing protein
MTAATVSRTEASGCLVRPATEPAKSVQAHGAEASTLRPTGFKGTRWPSRVQAGEVMSAPVKIIDARATMWEAARRLFGDRDAHLVVMDGSRPVAVVNETVITLQWPCGPLSAYRRELQDLTPRRVRTVLPDVDVADVADIMLGDGVEAVPVVTPRGAVVGLVTVRNLLELLAGCPPPTLWPEPDEEASPNEGDSGSVSELRPASAER